MPDSPWETLTTIEREGSTQTIEVLHVTYKRSTVCVDGLEPAIGYAVHPFADTWYDTEPEAYRAAVAATTENETMTINEACDLLRGWTIECSGETMRFAYKPDKTLRIIQMDFTRNGFFDCDPIMVKYVSDQDAIDHAPWDNGSCWPDDDDSPEAHRESEAWLLLLVACDEDIDKVRWMIRLKDNPNSNDR